MLMTQDLPAAETLGVLEPILLPPDVALPTSYVNDVRFDLRRGADGVAYVTDSSDKGAQRHHRGRSGHRRELAAAARSSIDEGRATNQLHRRARFHHERDLRRKPHALFRIPIDAKPVLLR
jgi:sugar lactone lactonase YvrE